MKLVLTIGIFSFLLAPASGGEGRFQPERCFPGDALAFLEVRQVDGLLKGLGSSSIGRILTHPGFRAALGRVPDLIVEQLRQGSAEFTEMAGMDVLSALGLLHGGAAASLLGFLPDGKPRLAFALELGPEREKILGLFDRFEQRIRAAMGGGELPALEAGDFKVKVWPIDAAAGLGRVVLGTHIVFGFPADVLVPIAGRYGGTDGGEKDEPRALGDAPFFKALKERLEVSGTQVFLALNVEALRSAALAMLPPGRSEWEDAEKILKATGLKGAASFGWALGFRDGDFEAKLHISTPKGAEGILGAIVGSFRPPRDIDRALRMVPAGSTSIGAAGFGPGKLLSDAIASLRAAGLDLREPIDGLLKPIEAKLGITLEEDLAPLPPIGIVSFTIQPPAGSLFDDSLALVRTEEFEPYWKLAGKIVRTFGGVRSLEEKGRKIEYTSFLAALPLEDGWTAVSDSVQALRRYIVYYSGSPKVSESPDLIRECKERLSGAGAAGVLRQGKALLAVYNTLAALAGRFAPVLNEQLAPLGVDLALLPPGEEFLPGVRDGFFRLEAGKEGITFHGHRVIANTGILPVVAAASLSFLTGFTVPTLMRARGKAGEVRCQSNLREIMRLGLMYADTTGKGAYPLHKDGGIAALQILAESFDVLSPSLFICSDSGLSPASLDPSGKYILDPEHCSYEMVPWKISPSEKADTIVAYDRAPYHQGKRNVVRVDGSAELIDESEFQRRLSAQRVGHLPPPKTPEEKPTLKEGPKDGEGSQPEKPAKRRPRKAKKEE